VLIGAVVVAMPGDTQGDASVRHLFVYGTLRRGNANLYAWLLARGSNFVGVARVRGRLYRFKRYRAIRLDPKGAASVPGEIYLLRDPRRLFFALDRYEGAEFHRVLTEAIFPDASRLPCWVYELRTALSPTGASSAGSATAPEPAELEK
jgi:gamma-glutamylcyclotransferase (GGCT)/AIG2-like uncharacterized protein YtfP